MALHESIRSSTMILLLATWLASAFAGCMPQTVPSARSAALEGTQWILVRLDEKPVSVAAGRQAPSLTLVSKGKSASGFTGCNRFRGGYRVEGNALHFTGIAATRMFCANVRELEEQYIRVLDATARWKIVDGHLELYNATGALLALLTASP